MTDLIVQCLKLTERIFERCGLETIPVQADSGTMGGSASEEFMVASEVGEETLLLCEKCEYRANSEKAEYKRKEISVKKSEDAIKEVHTPDIKTIDALAAFFKCDEDTFLKKHNLCCRWKTCNGGSSREQGGKRT